MKKSTTITGLLHAWLVAFFVLSAAQSAKAQWTQTGFNAPMAGNGRFSILKDAGAIYASTSDFHFYRSDDNGATFADVAQSGIVQGVGIRGIFKMSDTLFIVDNTAISRSVDNGVTWSVVLPMYCSNVWVSPSKGTIIVDGSVTTTTIRISNDRGNTWTSPVFPVGTSATMYLQGYGDLNDSLTIFHGQNGSPYRILISGDNGATWSLRSLVTSFNNFVSYTSFDTTIVFAAARWNPFPNIDNGPYVSYDYGQTLSFKSTSCSESTANDFFMKTIHGVMYMYGTDNTTGTNIARLYKSDDQGLTWTELTGNLPNLKITCVEEYNGILYVGLVNGPAATGEIWTTDASVGLASAKNGSRSIAVFPNPASTNITLQLPAGETITRTKLYDAKGSWSEVKLSSNQLDIATLAEGIYFVELLTDRGLYHTRFVKQ